MSSNHGLKRAGKYLRQFGAALLVYRRLGIVVLLLVGGLGVAQDGSPTEIAKVIEQAQKGPEKETLELLQKCLDLADQAPMGPQERRDLAKQFIKTVQDRRLTMDQLEKVLAAKGKKQVARQVSYRRYVEQWNVVHPLSFRVLWDCPKGQDPTLRTIQVTP